MTYRIFMSLSSFTRAALAPVALAAMLLAPAHLAAQGPAPSDTGEDIRPIKERVEMIQPKQPPVTLWLCLGGGALLLAMAALWAYKYRRRQRLMSPSEGALAALTKLEASRDSMAAEAFAYLAAQVVRQYIADRFGLAAPRRTTEEFLNDLLHDEASVLRGECDALRAFLKSCDLAKFAASSLDDGQRAELLMAARGFVAATAAPVSQTNRQSVTP
ncbi:MAG: hypothetical protein RLZZ282_1340 [Verrucomicrobiota bacterium]